MSSEGMTPERATESDGAPVPFWKRPTVIIVAVLVLVAVLLGGSALTSRGFRFGKPSAGAQTLELKTGDPNALAPSGERLKLVTQPPAHTRVDIRLSKDLGDPTFAVDFQPYGLASHGTAVIRLQAVAAKGGNQLAGQFAKSLTGQNLQVRVGLDSVPVLKAGGRYAGDLRLVTKNGVSTFEIAGVTASKP